MIDLLHQRIMNSLETDDMIRLVYKEDHGLTYKYVGNHEIESLLEAKVMISGKIGALMLMMMYAMSLKSKKFNNRESLVFVKYERGKKCQEVKIEIDYTI